ncbi:MAG: glycosyltransferase family 4 protein, partial [Actinomycetota bacterium]
MTGDQTDATGSDPPRILVLFTDAISTRLVRGQLGHLGSAGFDVHVGTAVSTAGGPPTAADWDRLLTSLDPGVTPHHIPFVREPSPWRDLRALGGTISLIRQIRPDLVSVSTPKAGLIGMVAAWIRRVPVRVYTVRGLRFETLTGGQRRFYEITERLTIRLAHHVLFNSASLLRLAESHRVIRPGRGLVVGAGSGNGIDVDHFSPDHLPSRSSVLSRMGLPADARVIGFVGRLTADKGVDDLVQIFVDDVISDSRLSQISDRLHLVIVGEQEPGDPLSDRTSLLMKEHPRIHHLGWVDDPRDVYPAFDLLVFPSYREGLPNVTLEAQLCGVPVVGYAATGTVDAVRNGETGVLVPVGDRRGLA